MNCQITSTISVPEPHGRQCWSTQDTSSLSRAPAQLLGAGLTEVLPRLRGPLTPASPLALPKDHPRRHLSRTHQPGLMTCRQSTSHRDSPRDSECTRRTACQELGPERVRRDGGRGSVSFHTHTWTHTEGRFEWRQQHTQRLGDRTSKRLSASRRRCVLGRWGSGG